MTIATGTYVRLLVEVIADDNGLVPVGSRGVVVAYEGNRLIVELHDMDTDTRRTATIEVWEARRIS